MHDLHPYGSQEGEHPRHTPHGHLADWRHHGHSHGVVDPSIAASTRGLWALKWSFVGLMITALLQLVVVVMSRSVGLLADTISFAGQLPTIIYSSAYAPQPPAARLVN